MSDTIRYCEVVGAAERLYRYETGKDDFYAVPVAREYEQRMRETVAEEFGWEVVYDADNAVIFGTPGACFDVNGDRHHEPGSRWVPINGERIKCCGVVGLDAGFASAPEISTIEVLA